MVAESLYDGYLIDNRHPTTEIIRCAGTPKGLNQIPTNLINRVFGFQRGAMVGSRFQLGFAVS